MRFHDYHLEGYSVVDHGRRIIFTLTWNYPPSKQPDSILEFSDVAVYHFSHTESAIITDILEKRIEEIAREEEAFLRSAANQDGLRFWRRTFVAYIEHVKNDGYKAYRIESAVGFSGFIIAKALTEITPNQALEPTTLAVTIPAAQEVAPARVVTHL